MKRWAIGGAAVLAAAGAVGWYGSARRGPEIVVNAPVTPEPAPPVPAPAEPAILARVVDVADIDPLLDPPVIPAAEGAVGPVLIAVGYEEPAPAPVAPRDVPPIPPAGGDDDVEVAPMPREVSRRFGWGFDDSDGPGPIPDRVARHPSLLGELPVQSVRAGWYGDWWDQMERSVPDFWAEWTPFPPGFAAPPPRAVGIGFFF